MTVHVQELGVKEKVGSYSGEYSSVLYISVVYVINPQYVHKGVQQLFCVSSCYCASCYIPVLYIESSMPLDDNFNSVDFILNAFSKIYAIFPDHCCFCTFQRKDIAIAFFQEDCVGLAIVLTVQLTPHQSQQAINYFVLHADLACTWQQYLINTVQLVLVHSCGTLYSTAILLLAYTLHLAIPPVNISGFAVYHSFSSYNKSHSVDKASCSVELISS